MPRITKTLPSDRADYSFGDLVYWHLFKYGTRPSGDPADTLGRVWEIREAHEALDVSDRTLRNWIFDKNVPDSIVPLNRLLFGDNKLWNKARRELQDKHEQAWAARGRKPAAAEAEASGEASATELDSEAAQEAADSAQTDGVASGAPAGEEIEPPVEEADAAETTDRHPAAETSPSRALLSSETPRKPLPRHTVKAFVAGLAVVLAVYAWMQSRRHAEEPGSARQKTEAHTILPKEPAATKQASRATPSPAGETSSPVAEPRPSPAPIALAQPGQAGEAHPNVQAPALPPQGDHASAPAVPSASAPPPVATAKPEQGEVATAIPDNKPAETVPPQSPSPEEQRETEQRRIEEKKVKDRIAAYEAERKAKELEAIRQDSDGNDAAEQRQKREQEDRVLAGMGFRLRENMSVPKDAFANLLTDTVPDCAQACRKAKCDAFAYDRDGLGPGFHRPRYCFLFRKPFTPDNFPGRVLGESVADAASSDAASPDDSALNESLRQLAQSDRPASDAAPPQGVVFCSSGPVKVNGFTIECDHIMGGGTQLGSHRLRYEVNTINECAAKCRPIPECAGFTFNSAEPEGKRTCQIFGPTPSTRETPGWISGTRQR